MEHYTHGTHLVKLSGAGKGGVKVTVAGRAPFLGRVGRPSRRFHGGRVNLRHLVLNHEKHKTMYKEDRATSLKKANVAGRDTNLVTPTKYYV